ncbi:helix-turn-helix domain-containing protein [Saccharothrix hoggarensis]|uniref:Helix-turn-helix domain-containing protein n=1 Tax=Saccharothrix hoggarensis TaxID=913853 RepID=A0ABW3QML5_9PSEU
MDYRTELTRWLEEGTARRWRDAQRIPRKQAAADVGVDEATIRRWETGKTTPVGDNARRYHRWLRSIEPKT